MLRCSNVRLRIFQTPSPMRGICHVLFLGLLYQAAMLRVASRLPPLRHWHAASTLVGPAVQAHANPKGDERAVADTCTQSEASTGWAPLCNVRCSVPCWIHVMYAYRRRHRTMHITTGQCILSLSSRVLGQGTRWDSIYPRQSQIPRFVEFRDCRVLIESESLEFDECESHYPRVNPWQTV